ncbi:hypothetical protein D3C81_1969450 [compost metagenome]
MQLNFIPRPHQLLELQHFHPGKRTGQIEQLATEVQCPFHLHHAGQYRGFREVTTEISQVRRHTQLQAPFTLGLDLRQHFRRFRSRGHQQRFDIGLRQFALAVQR